MSLIQFKPSYSHDGSPPVADIRSPLGLKSAMRHLVGGVSVVTAGVGRDRTGATVTTAHSLSVEPETMLVSINLASSSFPIIHTYGHFCVNILAADQVDVANRFAGRDGVKGVARYDGADWTEGETGAAMLVGALASIDCAVEHVIERHSHALIFGAVRTLITGPRLPALIYAHGRYGAHGAAD